MRIKQRDHVKQEVASHYRVIGRRFFALLFIALIFAFLVNVLAALGLKEGWSFAIAAIAITALAAFENVKGRRFSLGMSRALAAFLLPGAVFAVDDATGRNIPDLVMMPAAVLLVIGSLFMLWAIFLRTE